MRQRMMAASASAFFRIDEVDFTLQVGMPPLIEMIWPLM